MKRYLTLTALALMACAFAAHAQDIKDVEIKHLLKNALTDKINDRRVFMKGIDHSYYYEGYATFKAENLK